MPSAFAHAFAAAALAFAAPAFPAPALDAFGIAQIHPTRPGTREWNSAHWENGTARLIGYSGNPSDPTGWSDNHSSGAGYPGGRRLEFPGRGRFGLRRSRAFHGHHPRPWNRPHPHG